MRKGRKNIYQGIKSTFHNAIRRNLYRENLIEAQRTHIAAASLAASQYRRHILSIGGAGNSLEDKIAKKKYAKDRGRKLLKSLRKKPRLPPNLLLSKYSEGKLATGLMPERKDLWVPLHRRLSIQNSDQLTLKEFSFIDRPQNTLDLLRKILQFEASSPAALLHFEDKYCSDIAAYLALAELWPSMCKIFRGGRMPPSIQKVIHAVRLQGDLTMSLPGVRNTDDVWAFPKRTRRTANSSEDDNRLLGPQTREIVADEFCAELDTWLDAVLHNSELTDEGRSRFTAIIGELLDNAERHSSPPGSDGSWSIAAFMARRFEGREPVFRCCMGFLSVGASIAESMQTAHEEIKSTVQKYVDRHSACGISPSTLTTLVALQDGITRDKQAASDGRGGIGFQEVLELIGYLGSVKNVTQQPRMTIVSGHSCIQARSPYVLGVRADDTSPRLLWFNHDNSWESPPDPSFVFDLNGSFPGTIIGLTFVLDASELRAAANGRD